MRLRQRYAMLTVDTEALPNRASDDHVERLVWGRHARGTAGIREIAAIGDEAGAKHVFFADLCGAWSRIDEMSEAVRWLAGAGQDVQLHAHPEVLPDGFWAAHGWSAQPGLMNEYQDDARAAFVIGHFGGRVSALTGQAVRAFRAGSFRWNACCIRALKTLGIPLSFNNSMLAQRTGQCPFSEPTNLAYAWSNGVIEVPVTERRIDSATDEQGRWVRATFPESAYFPYLAPRESIVSTLFGDVPALCVFLLHSWSLLVRDENGHATYQDDQRLDAYRKLLGRVTKDYDVITTNEFLDLHARGRIRTPRTIDVRKAESCG